MDTYTNSAMALFLPLNSPGHMSSSIAVADMLKKLYDFQCIFVVVGEAKWANLEKRGHTLTELKDVGHNETFSESNSMHWAQSFKGELATTPSEPMETLERMSKVVKEKYAKMVVRNAPQLERMIEEFRPNVIIVDDFFPPPFLLLTEDKWPWVRIHSRSPTSLLKPKLSNKVMPCPWLGLPIGTKAERQRMQQEEPEKWKAQLEEWKDKTKRAASLMNKGFEVLYNFYESYGFARRHEGKGEYSTVIHPINSPFLNIYLCPEELDFKDDDDIFAYPSRFLRCNSLVRESIVSKQDQAYWLELLDLRSKGKRGVIYFSLGSIASGDKSLTQRFLDMFAQDKRHLYVVSTGMTNKDVTFANNMMGGPYIPQPFLLRQVDVAILHGGNNGIIECLHYGVPMIVVPLFAEQLDNAQRIEEKKLGIKMDPYTCTAEELLGAVKKLRADTDLKERLNRISQRMRTLDEVELVADMIRKLSRDGQVDQYTLDKYNVTK